MFQYPKISIQIPTYNQAEFIGKAIESCLAQDYPNLEINIADDGSTDTTFEVVSPYLKDRRVKYYNNEINIGRVANYQKALFEYATGEWAANLDGDDYYIDSHWISNAVEYIKATEKKTGEKVLFYQGKSLKYRIANENKENKVSRTVPLFTLNKKEYIEWLSKDKSSFFNHLGLLVRREIAVDSDFYTVDIISSDYISILSMCLMKNLNNLIIIDPNIIGVWVQHGSNTTLNMNIKDILYNYFFFSKQIFSIKNLNYKTKIPILYYLSLKPCIFFYLIKFFISLNDYFFLHWDAKASRASKSRITDL